MNLQNLNVAELSAQEVRETEGGGLPLICLAPGWFIYHTLDNLSDIKESAKVGFNASAN